ncbi:MAG TPA: STAS/SEC14 domain-containing protein [Gammaproteobacteria bacterium]
MLEAKLMREDGILVLIPSGTSDAVDFERLHLLVDPYIEKQGVLNGVMIYADSYPGWEGFTSLLSQLRFIDEEKHRIRRVAAVTDSGFLSILPQVGNFFVDAEVRHFHYDDHQVAMEWLKGVPVEEDSNT